MPIFSLLPLAGFGRIASDDTKPDGASSLALQMLVTSGVRS
jgi:hypothetical protein